MVNSISSLGMENTAINAVSEENVKSLLKYMNNEALKEEPDTFIKAVGSSVKTAGIFGGMPLLNFLRKNKKVNGTFINDSMKSLGQINKEALKTLFKGEGKFSARVLDYIQSTVNSQGAFGTIKTAVNAQSKLPKLEGKAAKAAEKALNKSGFFTKKAAEKSASKLAAAKNTANAAKNTAQAAENLAVAGTKAAGMTGKLKSLFKSSGAGFMLAFSGIIEGVTEVLPTFKELGTKKGLKQLGKSAIKVVGDTVGYIAGQQAGAAIGSAIGTAICPGIGTAVGTVVGIATGMLGSWAAGKLTKKITGPSERELAKQEQFNQSVEEIANDETMYEELKTQAMAKIQEEASANNGKLSEDSQIILELLENSEMSNPFAA